MSRYKINYFFFIWTIVLPVAVSTVAIPIFWPWINNLYGNIILSPFWTVVGMYLWGFIFTWGIAAYMALPWLAVIRDDRIVFHRLFRRKLVIDLSKVRYAELHGQLEGRRRGNHISFIMDNGERWIAMGLNYEMTLAVLEHLKKKNIEVRQYAGGISDEEWKWHMRRGY